MISQGQWLAVQMGARMHYAVPAILARRGLLAELWTDAHADDWTARLARRVLPPGLRPGVVRSMLGRSLPAGIPRGSVRSFPMRTVWHRLRGRYVDQSINRQLLDRGFGTATGLYSLMFGDADVISEAKRRGLFVAFEQVISPEIPLVMAEERKRFAGVEAQETGAEDARYFALHRRIWSECDAILSPSHYVAEGIGRLGGDPAKIHLVPYAVDESWLGARPSPEPGRVLFVGAVGLRKGSHYLAQAARLLKERRVPCEIRVAGPVSARMAADPLFAGPTYAGQVQRAEVREEFLRADVFVLPSLVEGSATAHIEALACGIPVVTTANCGSLIRDGVEGFLVPVRDPVALADRIEALVTNRKLRHEMGARAKQLAQREHTWDRYEERLMKVLQA